MDGVNFALLEVHLGGGWGLLVYHILLFSLTLSGMTPDMTEILLTETLSLNSTNHKNIRCTNIFMWGVY